MTTSSDRRDNLSEAKRALLEKLLQGKRADAAPLQIVTFRPPDVAPRLSYAQERLWFLYQLQPSSSAYNMHEALRVQGPLDVEVLQRSLNVVIVRHEILRTTFVTRNQQLVQQVNDSLEVSINQVDLRALPPAAREAESHKLTIEASRHRFDLAELPLLHVRLLRMAEADHILLLTIHHIISDEWSNEVFWRELSLCYKAVAAGSQINLPALPLQYVDFAYWQRQWLAESHMQRQLDYWMGRLSGELPLLQLPTDRPRPVAQRYQGAWQSITLPPPMALALRGLSQRSGVTLFMTLLAAFNALLHRYTGQTDILVGTPIANRNRPEIENLIGFFLNTLVMRSDLSNNPRFVDLLLQVRDVALAGFANQDLPFEKLVDELRPTRDLSYNPLFQVMFVFQEAANRAIELPGLTLTSIPVDGGVSKFDLTLFTIDSQQGLQVALEYNTDLFDASTITRMLGHFRTMVEGIIANPEQRIAELPLLTDAERQQLLVEWNNTQQDYPQDKLVHQLVEEWAIHTPDAVALVFERHTLSYAEFNQRANQLAHYLRSLGVQPGALIGLCVERSLDMLVGILGILKAGAAYVPLDPAYPQERLAFVLLDTAASIVLTQQHVKNSLPSTNAQVFALDSDWSSISQQPTTNPPPITTPDDLAYVIYTSGSTGKPKGVPISHRQLVHSTTARFTFYEHVVQRFLLMSSFAFDSSIVGIFWSICQGGTLCLPRQKQEQDVRDIAELIARHKVTHMLSLPSLYNLLLEYADAEELASLNTVIVAGEACTADIVQRHYRYLPQATLYNEYGPTEGTVWSTACAVSSQLPRQVVPIGKPIPNMQNYILDSHLQPVPIGVAGELYIGGLGLTRGYLNRPELTDERFLPNPFSQQPAARLYKTGDLARYLPDGYIEFLGRVDYQVKIRGYRIELDEIELAVMGHPDVAEVVVVARQEQEMQTDSVLDDSSHIQSLLDKLGALDPAQASHLLADVEAMSDDAVSLILQNGTLLPEGARYDAQITTNQ